MSNEAGKKKAAKAKPAKVIEAYKGFDQNLACRGYQYEVGKTYVMSGPIEACERGFHSCENPFDVLTYYPLVDNRFCIVKASGEIARHGSDSKIASAKIEVVAELKLPEFIGRCVDWIIDATKGAKSRKGVISDEGGYGAQIGSSGNGARIGSSGYDARIGSSGNGARIGSSGYGARIGSSGYDARIGSSGNDARIGSSGNDARIDTSGERAVVACAGINAKVKGADGAWLSVAEYEYTSDGWQCVGFATGCVGKKGIKPDTWYRAQGGKLVAS